MDRQARALICGVSGQDGAYLAELLLSKGYEVWGTSRNTRENEFFGLKSLGIFGRVKIRSMSPEDFNEVTQVISNCNPREIYNLSGQSSVGLSFERPLETMASIATSTLTLLESIRAVDRSIRFFNAGSGECFGDTGARVADESTCFNPQSPYAISKAAATWQVSVYRQAFGIFACTGILFNHESPLRSSRFVTKKIVDSVIRIAHGSNEKLVLGNIDIRRDWGWASDYVLAMWRMLNRDAPEDFVIATGQSCSIRDFVEAAFSEAGLDWRDHVVLSDGLRRPSDPMIIRASPQKAKVLLDWNPLVAGGDVARRMYRETLFGGGRK